ncbi:unnamed protein product [Arabidopsis halleri]
MFGIIVCSWDMFFAVSSILSSTSLAVVDPLGRDL